MFSGRTLVSKLTTYLHSHVLFPFHQECSTFVTERGRFFPPMSNLVFSPGLFLKPATTCTLSSIFPPLAGVSAVLIPVLNVVHDTLLAHSLAYRLQFLSKTHTYTYLLYVSRLPFIMHPASDSDARHPPTSHPSPAGELLPLAAQEAQRRRGRERMARRHAAIKALPPEKQMELTECARAARAKYRETHRYLLVQKERTRRQKWALTSLANPRSPRSLPRRKSPLSLDEFLERRRVRENRPCYCTSKHHPRPPTESAPPPPPPFKTQSE
ncbi:hypothetical protein B0H11DRAFT_1914573 [Mycena galericulata]|nr:hypothetical protein B0H11DRAFT_1914573 [Mycena galericulata]